MDELERDLRAAFDHLADGPAPSDDLVDRTVDRSDHLRRRRRVVTASSFATFVLAASVVVASVAGAGSSGRHLQVSGPGDDGFTSDTTTTTTIVPTTTTIVIPPPPGPGATRPHTPGSTAPAISFVPAPCAAGIGGSTPDLEQFTLLGDGDIRVHYTWALSTEVSSFVHYRFDNGMTGDTDYDQIYTPAQFGHHWYDEWSVSDSGGAGCTTRHNFDVDPATATPDTVPTTTTTTTVPETTTTPTSDTTTTTVGG